VLQLYAYDEFGNVVLDSYIGIISPFLDLDQAEDGKEPFFPELRRTQIDNPYRYAGYEYLDGVKLYDLNARYYDPYTARFLSEDPYYNLGNRIIGLYEINTPNVISIMQANNLIHGRTLKNSFVIISRQKDINLNYRILEWLTE